MRIEGDVAIFESDEVFFGREETGLKPHTIRILDMNDYHALTDYNIKKIGVEHSTSETVHYFERNILSIFALGELLGEVLVGIAWIHEEEKDTPEQ